MATTQWQPERAPPPVLPLPPLLTAIGRGLLNRCPVCGKAHVFQGYLRVVRECANCGTPLGLARADDAPPYFTILIVGHLVIPSMLWMDNSLSPSVWTLAAIFVPATIVLSLALLRPIKGGTVGLMLKLGMLKNDQDE